MITSSNILFIISALLVAMIVWFIKSTYFDNKKTSEKKSVSYARGTSIIDFVNRVDQVVDSVKRAGDKRIVKYKDGTLVTYNDGSFELLNIDDVLVGKPCIFTYGVPSTKEKTVQIQQNIDKLKQEIAILRVKSHEDKKREIENIKDIAKKQIKENYYDK